MKIAVNIKRDLVAGITSTVLSVINHLHTQDDEFVGIEVATEMHMKGPVLFRKFSPEWFEHHIINIHNLPLQDMIGKHTTLKNLEQSYKEPIAIIQKVLRETKPDVLLLSGTYYLPWLISIAAQKEKLPIVLWYAGIYTRETSHNKPEFHKIYSQMEKSIVKRAKKIVFPSKLCRKVVEKEVVGKRLKNGYVIPNPISSVFTDLNIVGSSLERRIAAVGRYSKIKNFDVFFDLHKKLLTKKWNHTASFVTCHTQKIKYLPKSINTLPPMMQEGLKQFYLTQGLIVCPSTFETFGNVPMEAACLGIPVLVNENMGCAEVLKQVGLSSMVMSFDDINKVTDRVIELCGQHILPKQLNALKKILDYHFISEEIKAVLQSAI
jgi:glycosyltransferase involved in cell wall biosynthesis